MKNIEYKIFERGKVFIGMIMGMGLLFCGHNSVKAVQEEYTAGSSIKTEYEGEVNYDEDIQTYSSGEILAQSASGWRKDNNAGGTNILMVRIQPVNGCRMEENGIILISMGIW